MKTLSNRFEEKTWPEPNTGCLLWTGAIRSNGYPVLWVAGRLVNASHVAMFLTDGAWPTEWVLHRCDTPPCVERSHLFDGTHADNMADMASKGRARGGLFHKAKTHCPSGHAYAGENVTLNSKGERACRTCRRLTTSRYRLSLKEGCES